MLCPLSWLQDYVDLSESVEELSDLLTFSGIEVEGIETIGSDFAGIVVAEIISIRPHPQADKLRLCTVEFGGEEALEVVCGAPNVSVGLKTMFAPVGTTLPGGLKLKKAKIRGVESLGMLCAEDELGLSSDHAGIMELDPSWAPGTAAAVVLGPPEIVFDLEITPNRPDSLSIIGVARELAALTNRSLKLPKFEIPEVPKLGKSMDIEFRSSETACPRYSARLLENCSVKPSPEWMQKRLKLCGLRPINNLVDITNYVMLETGQPLHAFDRSLIGNKIVIRFAENGERMSTLDNQEHELCDSDLLIADENQSLALAGIMGGANSDIRETTSSVLLEAANFESSGIRATAKRLGISTDSSYRFARMVDPETVAWVNQRAASLICEWSGAQLAGQLDDQWPGKQERRVLEIRWQKICDLIGIEIPSSTMRGYFERLELEVLQSDDEGCTLSIPGFRSDLLRPVDLIEEVARLHGLDNIPAPVPTATLDPHADDYFYRVQMFRVWNRLAHQGFQEIMNYSLSAAPIQEQLAPTRMKNLVRLPNPISQDQSVLRVSLIPQMAETLIRNRMKQNPELLMYEVGKCYLQTEEDVAEISSMSFGLLGPVLRGPLDKQRPMTDAEAFFGLKGQIEQLMQSLHLEEWHFEALEDTAFAPGQAASILVKGRVVGRMGLLNATQSREWKLTEPMALAEIELEPILPGRNKLPSMSPIPETPSSSRDVALILNRSIQHADVMKIVNHQRPKDLEDVKVFDLFVHERLGADKKSQAYRFTYRNPKKTLTDKAIDKMHQRIVQRLQDELGASIAGLT